MISADRPRHVAFVLAGLGAGGAERVVSLLASGLLERGDRITVVAFDHEHDPVYHRFDPRVQLLRLDSGGLPRRGPLAPMVRVVRLRRALARLGPDAVISFLTKINVVTLLATIGLPIPVIVAERNNPLRQTMNRGWTMLLDRLYPRASAIVLQTEASRICLPAAVASHAWVIPNPVEAFSRERTPGNPLVIAGVGRLERQKGMDLLLLAAARLAAVDRNWRLTIWGEGPERPALSQMAADLGIADLVAMPGNSPAPRSWASCADVFVLSSRYEGFPNALAEAMAAGLPVVAFDCPFGPSDLVQDGSNGLLVREGDVAALAVAMRTLLWDAALRSRLGASATAVACDLAPEKIVRRWHQALASALGRMEGNERLVNFYSKGV